MTSRPLFTIVAAVIAAAFLSWFVLANNVVDDMIARTSSEESEIISTPLVVLGLWAALAYPLLFTWMRWLRQHIRLVAGLSIVVYLMVLLLVAMAFLASLSFALERGEPDVASAILICLATLALLVGTVTLHRRSAQRA